MHKIAVISFCLERHLKESVELGCDSTLLGMEADSASWRAQNWVHVSTS